MYIINLRVSTIVIQNTFFPNYLIDRLENRKSRDLYKQCFKTMLENK